MQSQIDRYKQYFNLQNASFSRIEHEDAMVAIVYHVQLGGNQYVLKVCERFNDYLREIYFLKQFICHLPVPRIIQVSAPDANIPGAILMEFVPGVLLKAKDYSESLAYEMGSILARIHLSRTAGYGDLIQPENLSSDPRLPFTMKFEEGLDECKDHLPKSLIQKARRYFDAAINQLESVDGPCVIHRDFRAGNVIINEGRIRGVIDWSSARAGFAEDDFCMLEHEEWSIENKESFLAGYGSIRTIPNYTKIMPLLRLNRAVATVGFTVKRGTWKTESSKVYQINRRFLESFFN